jgi:hypothetical protein
VGLYPTRTGRYAEIRRPAGVPSLPTQPKLVPQWTSDGARLEPVISNTQKSSPMTGTETL